MAPMGGARSAIVSSGGPAIPDSGADHQWNYDEGSGTIVEDYNGSLSISFTDGTWESGTGIGDTYLSLDGTDDYGDLGADSQSELSHFVNGQGTWFQWARCDSTSGIQVLLISDGIRSSDTGFSAYIDWDDPDIRWACRDGGSRFIDINPTGTVPSQGDWVAYTGTADGSNAELYYAEPPDYDLVELGTDSVDGGTTDDLSASTQVFRDDGNNDRHWNGGVSLGFTDSVGWTQSELQNFVDDTKEYFE